MLLQFYTAAHGGARPIQSKSISQFLQRDVNKGFAEVTGHKVIRGAGYGLEIPVVYRLYIEKMKALVRTKSS